MTVSPKPKVLFFDQDNSNLGEVNLKKESMMYLLQEMGFDSVNAAPVFSQEDKILTTYIKQWVRSQKVVCAIMEECDYDEDGYYTKHEIKEIRGHVPVTIAILVRKRIQRIHEVLEWEQLPNVHPIIFDSFSKESNWKEIIQEVHNKHRASTYATANMRHLSALASSYDQMLSDDGVEELYPKSDAEKAAFQLLRLHQKSGHTFVRRYFDELLQQPEEEESIKNAEYDADVMRLKSLSSKERQELLNDLENRHDGVSWGHECGGYAIDTDTLIDTAVWRYGLHAYAPHQLSNILDEVERHGAMPSPNKETLRGVWDALLARRIESYNTPIAFFLDKRWNTGAPLELRRIGECMLSRKKYIPVDHTGKLIDAEYGEDSSTTSLTRLLPSDSSGQSLRPH